MTTTPIANTLQFVDSEIVKAIERLELENQELKDRIKFLERSLTKWQSGLERLATDKDKFAAEEPLICVCKDRMDNALIGRHFYCPIHGQVSRW